MRSHFRRPSSPKHAHITAQSSMSAGQYVGRSVDTRLFGGKMPWFEVSNDFLVNSDLGGVELSANDDGGVRDFASVQQRSSGLPGSRNDSIYDSANICTLVIAIVLIVYGSFRSMKVEQESSGDGNSDNDSNNKSAPSAITQSLTIETLDSCQVILLPFGASISLLLMFYFFDSLQTLFTLCSCVLATFGLAFLLVPFCRSITGLLFGVSRFSFGVFGRHPPANVLAGILAIGILCTWLATGHWLLMDVLGIGLTVAFIALIRLPSLKVSTMLLIGLLIYDLFWVFFSSYLFRVNVMMKVATRAVDNPVDVLAKKFPIYSDSNRSGPKLSLPGKLLFPSTVTAGKFSMLGIGDIILPGLLVCFLLRYDANKRNQLHSADAGLPPPSAFYQRITYFHCSLIGYFVGLLTATVSSHAFETAQPALLYLVPFTLLPLLVMAYQKGDLRRMWSEPFQQNHLPQCNNV